MSCAITLAGEKDVQFEGNIPKQFIELMGESLLVYPMETAQKNDDVDAICVVSPKKYYDRIRTQADKYHITKLLFVTEAGREQYQSVHSGLKSLPARTDDMVIIATAVHPFVPQLTVDRLYKAMETKDTYTTAVETTDATAFNNNGGSVLRTLQKEKLFIQQGPRLFRYSILKQAYKTYLSDENRTEIDEDSELVLDIRVECGMVMDDRFCIKVAYPGDLAAMEALYPLFIKQETEIGEGM